MNFFTKYFKRNMKGIALIDDIVIIAVVGIVLFFAGPPLIKSVGTLFSGGDKNQTKQVHKVNQVRTVYVPNPTTGKLEPQQEKYTEYTNQTTAMEPPETLWQKFWHLGFIAVLIIVILSYLGLWPIIVLWWNKVVKPKIIQAQTNLENLQEEHDELRGDAKLIVKSVDEGLAAMNTAIAAAQATYDTAQNTLNSAMLMTDVTMRTAAITNAQHSISDAKSVLDAVTCVKKEFLSAMSRKQDTTTKMLVAELKND